MIAERHKLRPQQATCSEPLAEELEKHVKVVGKYLCVLKKAKFEKPPGTIVDKMMTTYDEIEILHKELISVAVGLNLVKSKKQRRARRVE